MYMLSSTSTQIHPFSAPALPEYQLVAYPDAGVCERIRLEKQQFFQDYQESCFPRLRPFITLARFQAKEEMEETLMRWIHRVCVGQPSFCASVNNFSGFPPHTIYLRIQDPAPFRRLAAGLEVIDGFVQSNGCPPVTLVTTPFLPLAIRLKNEVYERALADYARRVFHASFLVGELALLRQQTPYEAPEQRSIFRLSPTLETVH